jgi:prevent-host-death family protein
LQRGEGGKGFDIHSRESHTPSGTVGPDGRRPLDCQRKLMDEPVDVKTCHPELVEGSLGSRSRCRKTNMGHPRFTHRGGKWLLINDSAAHIIRIIRFSIEKPMSQTTAVEFQRKFGAFQHQAQREPVEITRHGRRELVLMSADHYDWLIAAARRTHRTAEASSVVANAVRRAEMDSEHAALDDLLK